jgi:hypothetical protein
MAVVERGREAGADGKVVGPQERVLVQVVKL